MTMSKIRMSHDGNAKFMTLPTSANAVSHSNAKGISFCQKFRDSHKREISSGGISLEIIIRDRYSL